MITAQEEEAKVANPKEEFYIHIVFDKDLNYTYNMQGQPWPPAKEVNPKKG